jgi:SAM-dependent methyltransferase
MAEDELIQLLGEQIAYYSARAIEYDRTAPFTDHDGDPELSAALERFAPRGRVLELACGTGQWTKELAEYAMELTAVDASEEMLTLNRATESAAKESRRRGRADWPFVRGLCVRWAAADDHALTRSLTPRARRSPGSRSRRS